MGLILDSSILVAAERQGQNARQMLSDVSAKVGETDIALSVITLIELAHGATRANTPERKAKREQFIQELLIVLPIHPSGYNLTRSERRADRWGESGARSYSAA